MYVPTPEPLLHFLRQHLFCFQVMTFDLNMAPKVWCSILAPPSTRFGRTRRVLSHSAWRGWHLAGCSHQARTRSDALLLISQNTHVVSHPPRMRTQGLRPHRFLPQKSSAGLQAKMVFDKRNLVCSETYPGKSRGGRWMNHVSCFLKIILFSRSAKGSWRSDHNLILYNGRNNDLPEYFVVLDETKLTLRKIFWFLFPSAMFQEFAPLHIYSTTFSLMLARAPNPFNYYRADTTINIFLIRWPFYWRYSQVTKALTGRHPRQ